MPNQMIARATVGDMPAMAMAIFRALRRGDEDGGGKQDENNEFAQHGLAPKRRPKRLISSR